MVRHRAGGRCEDPPHCQPRARSPTFFAENLGLAPRVRTLQPGLPLRLPCLLLQHFSPFRGWEHGGCIHGLDGLVACFLLVACFRN